MGLAFNGGILLDIEIADICKGCSVFSLNSSLARLQSTWVHEGHHRPDEERLGSNKSITGDIRVMLTHHIIYFQLHNLFPIP